jgi:mRNA-degrading endonuclease toxin of MazEF toxin-antitoxin module
MMALQTPADWFPRRGEIYLVRLGKDRPAMVVSSDILNRHALDVCVVSITSVEHARFSLLVPLKSGEGGVDRASWVKCDQVSTIPKYRLRFPPLGRLAGATLLRIETAIKTALDLP